MADVRVRTRESLIAEREAILASLGRDEGSLRAGAVNGGLSGDEWFALERLDAIEFLLGDSRPAVA